MLGQPNMLTPFKSPQTYQIEGGARRVLQGMASPFQSTQQSSVIDLKIPEGGAEMANFVVKSFAMIMISFPLQLPR